MKNTLETWLLTTKWQWWGVGMTALSPGSAATPGAATGETKASSTSRCTTTILASRRTVSACGVSTISSLHCFNRLESSNCCWKYPPFLPCSGRPIDSADSDRKQ